MGHLQKPLLEVQSFAQRAQLATAATYMHVQKRWWRTCTKHDAGANTTKRIKDVRYIYHLGRRCLMIECSHPEPLVESLSASFQLETTRWEHRLMFITFWLVGTRLAMASRRRLRRVVNSFWVHKMRALIRNIRQVLDKVPIVSNLWKKKIGQGHWDSFCFVSLDFHVSLFFIANAKAQGALGAFFILVLVGDWIRSILQLSACLMWPFC